MNGLIDWATGRARMIIALVVLSLAVGGYAFVNLPKEGEPDIDIPALFVSVPFPGISAQDAEKLLVRPLEAKLRDLEGLKTISSTASENFAGVALEFEFGWDKSRTMADVRDRVDQAQAEFPADAEEPTIEEINFSEFPIVVVALSGDVPERTLLRTARALQDRIEALPAVLEAPLAGDREEMMEVLIDPLKLEAYNVTAGELIAVVTNSNRLVAAGEARGATGAFGVKIPASFDGPQDIYDLPVKVNGDRVVTLGDLAEIRLTFEDREGTARFNGDTTVALQVVKRKGFNIIDTVALVQAEVAAAEAAWPEDMRAAIRVDFTMDESVTVKSMVDQLQGAVLTAIALVMIVVLAALGPRAAMLVGFAIPTSFLLCFALLAMMDVAISNMVMFGLILAVGMLVDGAIVVVEYADKRIAEGQGPMRAYAEAAKRMFWPVTASTATTLCAFLPMLFWPGVPGEFMSMLPVTLIFVLSASLVVALIFLPVVGGVAGRISRTLGRVTAALCRLPLALRVALAGASLALLWVAAMQALNPAYIPGLVAEGAGGLAALAPGAALFVLAAIAASVTLGAVLPHPPRDRIAPENRLGLFGGLTRLLTHNPVMPLVVIAAVAGLVGLVFMLYAERSLGVEFFVETEPERAIAYVRARGNLGIEEKDALLRAAEARVVTIPGVESVFAFAGSGGLRQNTGGASEPRDTVGQIQIELAPWDERRKGKAILAEALAAIRAIPGIEADLLEQADGPAQGKPVALRVKGQDWERLLEAAAQMRARFEATEGLIDVEDTRPLPGIDWEIDVDVAAAGRFGADVATVGGMVQLVTRGLTLDTMRVDSSDEEIDIRIRFPEGERLLSTLDTLKVRTAMGLVPLDNFITRSPVPRLAQIDRVDGARFFDIKANVAEGLENARGQPINANERIAHLTERLKAEEPLPAGIAWEWTGDQEDQAESQAFLTTAFAGALGLMFIILLTQFNSFYNSVLVLVAVVLSTAGVLVGMMVMAQPFSVIMTGTGIVALAGIVVNNNIVLIDTYQDYARYMPRLHAIARTAQDRLRPVLLTTITTMAGLAPMMYGLSIDFVAGGYTVDAPTVLWWKQLATAVVFGLGFATLLTLVLTPALLAARIWAVEGAYGAALALAAQAMSRRTRLVRDRALARRARRATAPVVIWEPGDAAPGPARVTDEPPLPLVPVRAAE